MVSTYSLAPIEVEDEETIMKIHKHGTPFYIEYMNGIEAYLILEENDFQN